MPEERHLGQHWHGATHDRSHFGLLIEKRKTGDFKTSGDLPKSRT